MLYLAILLDVISAIFICLSFRVAFGFPGPAQGHPWISFLEKRLFDGLLIGLGSALGLVALARFDLVPDQAAALCALSIVVWYFQQSLCSSWHNPKSSNTEVVLQGFHIWSVLFTAQNFMPKNVLWMGMSLYVAAFILSGLCIVVWIVLPLLNMRPRLGLALIGAAFLTTFGLQWHHRDLEPLETPVEAKVSLLRKPVIEDELFQREDLVEVLLQIEPDEQDFNEDAAKALLLLKFDGGLPVDLTSIQSAFETYMDNFAMPQLEHEEFVRRAIPNAAPVSQYEAENLGLFRVQDYAAVTSVFRISAFDTLLKYKLEFLVRPHDMLVYAAQKSGQVTPAVAQTLAAQAMRFLPVPGSHNAAHYLLYLDRLMQRLDPENYSQWHAKLTPLVRQQLLLTWSGYSYLGGASFLSDEDSQIEFHKLATEKFFNHIHNMYEALLLIHRFNLAETIDVLALETELLPLCRRDHESGQINLIAVAARSLIRSWPAYQAQVTTPYQMNPAEALQHKVRIKAAIERQRRHERAPKPHEWLLFLGTLCFALSNLVLTMRYSQGQRAVEQAVLDQSHS